MELKIEMMNWTGKESVTEEVCHTFMDLMGPNIRVMCLDMGSWKRSQDGEGDGRRCSEL